MNKEEFIYEWRNSWRLYTQLDCHKKLGILIDNMEDYNKFKKFIAKNELTMAYGYTSIEDRIRGGIILFSGESFSYYVQTYINDYKYNIVKFKDLSFINCKIRKSKIKIDKKLNL